MDGQVKNQSEPWRWKIQVIKIHCVLLASDANYESRLQYLLEDSRETLWEPCHQCSHFQEQQAQQRHSQSVTSVIINPVAVEDFRSRVEGRVVVEGSGRERGAMNSSGSGSGGEGGGKFIVPGLFCSLPFTSYYLLSSAGGSGENKENRGELPTPSSTPTSVRKNRRRSNLFTPSAKGKEKFEEKKPGEVVVIKFHFLTLLSWDVSKFVET